MVIEKASTYRKLFFAVGLAIASIAVAAERQNVPDSRVHVTWTNPADFSDAKSSPGSTIGRVTPDEWLGELAKHLRYRAERALSTGQRLDVTFTDVQRAGRYEPWRGPRWDDVRVIKDIYPPSIELRFKLTDAGGAVVKEGTRKLRDPAFLQRSIPDQTDSLRFEKRMLDDWLRTEFPNAGDADG